jgi:WD40 repeat protein
MKPKRLWHTCLMLAGALFLSVALAQQPVKTTAYPPINPAVARLDVTMNGLDGPGFAIATHERSGMVAVGCEEGGILYWRKDVVMGVRSGDHTPNVLRGHMGPVLAVVWNQEGILASAGADGKIILWDFAGAKPRYTITPRSLIRALAMSPDGKMLAGGGEDMVVHFWDVHTGKVVEAMEMPLQFKGHTDWILSLAFSSDGKKLASGGHDGTVRLWDMEARKKLLDIVAKQPPPPNTPPEPAPTVYSLTFSPDSKQLVVGNAEAQILFFNIGDGKFLRLLPGHASSVTGLVFHPNGTVLVSSSKDRTVRLWNPANGQLLKTLEGHVAWVEGVVFVANGTRLASVGADRTLRLWDLTTPPPK